MNDELIDPRLLGQRLVQARKSCGKTQEEAAAHLGCSRPTLIAIEKGDRPVKPEEIMTLSAFYGRNLHEIVRSGASVVALQPHLRSVVDTSRGGHEGLNSAIAELERYAEDYRQLEEILGAPMVMNYPPEVRLPSRGNIATFCEDAAMSERRRLGLGDQPILELRRLLEAGVGVRVFNGAMPSEVAGMYAYVAELGYCILINAKHPAERRRASLAHEYGHFLCDRHKPGIDYLRDAQRKPLNERFAERFGLSYLMPASGVRRQFHEIVASTKDFQVADLCRLSRFYYVSVEAMALRLEELRLIARGSWRYLKESGFQPRRAAKDLGFVPQQRVDEDPYPERYRSLAVQAYVQERISEGQLCRFLRRDRVAARRTVAECSTQSFLDDATGEFTDVEVTFEPRSLLNAG